MAQDRNARESANIYRHAIDGCLDGTIGQYGLTQAELASWLDRLAPALARLQNEYTTRSLPHLRVPEETADIATAEAAFTKLCRGAGVVIFFGIGGSSLGGQTLAQLGGWNIPGTADEVQKQRPRTRFYDNLDGATLQSALSSFDDLGTAFLFSIIIPALAAGSLRSPMSGCCLPLRVALIRAQCALAPRAWWTISWPHAGLVTCRRLSEPRWRSPWPHCAAFAFRS